MPEDILVVEYEPRYTDRVRQALNGQPFTAHFAKDGEEALRALNAADPRLIVLSSVIPKITTTELIKQIRGQEHHRATPILITVSGYNGKSTSADAGKVGATDILPKPYSESEFLGKVRQLLGQNGPVEAPQSAQFTSDQIFGDLVDEETPASKKAKAASDLDKMLDETLSGLRTPKKKTEEAPRPAPVAAPAPAPAAPRPVAEAKPKSSSADLDKLLSDTLSGLNVKRPAESAAATVKVPVVTPPAPPIAELPPVAPNVLKSTPLTPAAAPARVEPEPEVAETDGVRFGQYVLLERIASGGMAEVWKARKRGEEGFQKIVAIKKILPHLSDNSEFIEMFVDEAKLAAQLSHNNIIHIYDLGKVTNSYFIAMEYIDGHDLKSILKQGNERVQPMPVELALFIASKIAAALDYAHRKRDFNEKELGLVHRDVSPQNVLISYEGDIKLCDFGIAKAASKASHTQAGALKGKLQYMSPEQAWGRKIDRRSDIFALSAVLFEMLTGRKLFTGDSEISILEQVREARVMKPSDVNDEATPEVDKIVLKGLEKDPDSRYQTAAEMARDLDQVLYSFKPTPTSADLAIYMHRIYGDEPIDIPSSGNVFGGAEPMHAEPAAANLLATPEVIEIPAMAPEPVVEEKPRVVTPPPVVVAPPVAPAITEEAPRSFAEPDEEKKKLPIIPIAAILVIALAIGGYLMMRKGSSSTDAAARPTTTATATAATIAPPVGVPVDPATASVPATGTLAPVVTTTALGSSDQALIDQEVQKRIAEERARLEAQQRAQAQQQTAAATPAPVQAPPQPQPQPQAQPVAPPVTPPTATVAETRPEPAAPAPQEAAPQQARAREGDLVETGAEGLNPPELVRLKEPVYPPVARMRKIQGEVMLNALISETGRVLDVKVIRGVSPDLGFSSAAMDAVRGATFRPATKDGVRVKAYKTIKVSFKL